MADKPPILEYSPRRDERVRINWWWIVGGMLILLFDFACWCIIKGGDLE